MSDVSRLPRARVLSVVDGLHAGRDAGEVLDGQPKDIPVFATVEEAVRRAEERDAGATHLVVGLAPDGGRLSDEARDDIKKAVASGLHVDSGLHDFLSEDEEIAFNAGSHTELIRMEYRDFERLVQPKVIKISS